MGKRQWTRSSRSQVFDWRTHTAMKKVYFEQEGASVHFGGNCSTVRCTQLTLYTHKMRLILLTSNQLNSKIKIYSRSIHFSLIAGRAFRTRRCWGPNKLQRVEIRRDFRECTMHTRKHPEESNPSGSSAHFVSNFHRVSWRCRNYIYFITL